MAKVAWMKLCWNRLSASGNKTPIRNRYRFLNRFLPQLHGRRKQRGLRPGLEAFEQRVLLSATQLPFQTEAATHNTAVPALNDNYETKVADWNGDGSKDLFVIRHTGTSSGFVEVSIYSGATGYTGAPLLQTTSSLPTVGDYAFTIADYQNDGTLDLFAFDHTTGDTRLRVLSGSNGFFSSENIDVYDYFPDRAYDIEMLDRDADGTLDLHIAFKAFPNDPANLFVDVLSGVNRVGADRFKWTVDQGAPGFGLNAGEEFKGLFSDLDNDGLSDLVFIKTAGTASGLLEVHVIDGRPGEPFHFDELMASLALPLSAAGSEYHFSLTDLTADGVLDLVVTQSSSAGTGTAQVHVFSGVFTDIADGAVIPLAQQSGASPVRLAPLVLPGNVAIVLSADGGIFSEIDNSITGDAGSSVSFENGNFIISAPIVVGQVAITTEFSLTGDGSISAPGGILYRSAIGTILIDTTTSSDTPLLVESGTVKGSGNVQGPVEIGTATPYEPGQVAILAPGNSPGILSVGSLTLKSNSQFQVELNGSTPGTGYDQIISANGVSLGNSRLVVSSGYTPAAGQEFVIVKNNSFTAVAGVLNDANGNPLAEGGIVAANYAGTGRNLRISYTGGDGNDVVLVLDGPWAVTSPTNAADSELKFVRSGSNLLFMVNGVEQARRLLVSVSELTVTGEAGYADELVFDFSGGNPLPPGGITLNSFADATDTITLQNGSVTSVTHTLVQGGNSTITVVENASSATITYGQQPRVNDLLTAGSRSIVMTAQGQTATLADSTISNRTRLTTSHGRQIDFRNPSTALSLTGGTAADQFVVQSLGSGFVAALNLDTGSGADSISVASSLTGLASLSFKAAAIQISASGVSTSGTQTYEGAVSITGSTSFSGMGQLFLKGNLNAVGSLHISNPVVLQSSSAWTIGGNLELGSTLNGAYNLQLNVTGSSTFVGAVGNLTPLGVTGGAALDIASTGTTEFQSTVSTSKYLNQLNAAGAITFRNNVTVTDAVTESTFDANVILDGLTYASSGNVKFGSAATDVVTLSTANVTFNIASAMTATFNSSLNGDSGFIKTGAGTMFLKTASTYAGQTRLTGGSLTRSAPNLLPVTTTLILDAGRSFSLQNRDEQVASLSGGGNLQLGTATFTLANASTTHTGVIAGTGNLVVNGGTQSLGGNNTYTGTTTVNGGSLLLAGGTLGATAVAGLVTVANGATFGGAGTVNAQVQGAAGSTLRSTGNLTMGLASHASGVSTAGHIAVGTTGTMTLLDADTVTIGGNVTLSGGTLNVARAFSIGAGQTVSGLGAIAADTGVLTFTGMTLHPTGPLGLTSFTIDSASTVQIELGAGRLNTTGTVTLNSPALNITAASGYTNVPGVRTFIIENDGTEAIQGEFAAFPQGKLFGFGNNLFSRMLYRDIDPGFVNDVVARAYQVTGADPVTVSAPDTFSGVRDGGYAGNSAGQTLYSYLDYVNGTLATFYRVLDANGNTLVEGRDSYLNNNPMIRAAMDAAGNFLIAGVHYDGAFTSTLAIRRYSPSGQLLGTTSLAIDASTFRFDFKIAMADDGRFVMTYVTTLNDKYHLRAIRFSETGVRLDPTFLAVASVDANVASISLAQQAIGLDAQGNFIISWLRAASPSTVYYRRFSSAGAALDASPVSVQGNLGFSSPSVVMAPNGGFVIGHSFVGAGNAVVYRVRQFNPAGQQVAIHDLRGWAGGSLESNFNTIAVNSLGQYVVVNHAQWEGVPDGGYAHVFDADGRMLAGPITVFLSNPDNDSTYDAPHTLTMGSDGSFRVIYIGDGYSTFFYRQYNESPDVSMQSITRSGGTITLNYFVRNTPPGPIELGFYKSSDAAYSGADQLLSMFTLSGADLTAGAHTRIFQVGTGPGELNLPTGENYHLLAVLDPGDMLFENDFSPWNDDNARAVLIESNVPPVVTQFDGSVSYTENAAPVLLDNNSRLTDFDTTIFNGGSITISLTAGSELTDILGIKSVGNGSGQVNVNGNLIRVSGIVVGTLTGGTNGQPLVITLNANAVLSRVQKVLQSVTFSSTSENPSTAIRTVQAIVADGTGAQSLPVTKTLTATAVNDAPTVAGLPTVTTYTENALPVRIALSGTAVDPDSPNLSGGKLTVSITANSQATDVLAVQSLGYGPGEIAAAGFGAVYYEGVEIGVFTGGTNKVALNITFNESATPAAVQALLRAITFHSTSENPVTAARTVRFILTDGDGGSSAPVTTNVNITAVNDAPLVGAFDGSVDFIGPAPVLIDTDTTVSDIDSADLNGGKMNVSLISNGQGSDVLSIRNHGTLAGRIGVDGANVTYGGVVIGTFTGGINKVALVVTFNASATPAAAQALVRNLQFNNAAATRSTVPRTVRVLLTDGDGGTSTAVTKTITVAPGNSAPVIVGFEGSVTYFAADGQSVLLDADSTITDSDSADLNTGKLTVTITANKQATDILSILNEGTGSGQIGVSGNVVTFGGVIIGTFTGGTSNVGLTVTLNGQATPAAAQALLRAMTYRNSSSSPNPGQRTIRVILTDGDGGTSTAVTKTIDFA
ncbi:FG-GAP-like repeat-containing protein [Planctomicrobium piriforme]|uniref:Autotransporter-associated beta strand repeat-containing protein n=1 Tax=Planctomicrobium piriforme TaxID=1576369 RepID=A0A1I3Q0L4_9PLAN|nr:FG-GAP-like repeat-containing protein [Planctomicrobium piriforme]SFJ26696.1 autotransporter-associated beta strand repeat-containing protein [Planctomicrobium piriforme]